MRVFLILMMLLYTNIAAAVTVTFDEVVGYYDPRGSATGGYNAALSAGFRFVSLSDVLITDYQNLATGPFSTLEISAANGDPFSLFSFDREQIVAGDFRITGYLVGGGTIATDRSAGAGKTTVLFDSAWQNLSKVEFTPLSGNFEVLDNFVVTTVPIPAAVWLFGSGLGLLGWMRRKPAV